MALLGENQLRVGSKDAEDEEKTCLYATQLVHLSTLTMTLKAAIELGLFEHITAVDPDSYLSADEIAGLLGTNNPHAPAMIHRILSLLASYSIFTFSDSLSSDGRLIRRYGAAPVSKYFTSSEGNASMATMSLMNLDKSSLESWSCLKDSVMKGGIAFNIAHGIQAFEYISKDQNLSKIFNETMKGQTSIIMSKILKKYEGLEDLQNIVDVGGGTGITLHMIREKYPHIMGINFDLPHVISEAPPLSGITHVGGDMFESIPSGKVMFMKSILHDWGDDHCIKILKNCWKSLPNDGKIVLVEYILPNTPGATPEAQTAHLLDMLMLAHSVGGKERTKKEFKALALQSGFSKFKSHFCYANFWVMEISK